MSGMGSAASVSVRCTRLGNNLFQILEPFSTVFEIIKQGGVVSFAKPVQDGTVAVGNYSLLGSREAINRTLDEAARRARQSPAPPQVKPPSSEPLPGSKKLQDSQT